MGVRLAAPQLGDRCLVRRARPGRRLQFASRRGFAPFGPDRAPGFGLDDTNLLRPLLGVVDRPFVGRDPLRPRHRQRFRFLLLLACSLGLQREQLLAVGDGDLVVVGVDFAEREEPVPPAAILDEGGLQARLYADDLGEIDIALELPLARGLDVVILNLVAVEKHHPRLFRVGGVDQDTFGHSKRISGGPARPRDQRAAGGGIGPAPRGRGYRPPPGHWIRVGTRAWTPYSRPVASAAPWRMARNRAPSRSGPRPSGPAPLGLPGTANRPHRLPSAAADRGVPTSRAAFPGRRRTTGKTMTETGPPRKRLFASAASPASGNTPGSPLWIGPGRDDDSFTNVQRAISDSLW